MLSNYLKVAVRDILRHKFYTMTNILGLVSGMVALVLISLWVLNEWKYDRFHENAEQIRRVTVELTLGDKFRPAASSMLPLVPAAIDRFPAIIDGVTIRPDGNGFLNLADREIPVSEVLYASRSFFNMFSFRLLSGDKDEVLKRPYTIVISTELAAKMFGSENPMGRFVRVNDQMECEITGIAEKAPENSHFLYDVIISLETFKQQNPNMASLWGRMGNYSYIQIAENTNESQLAEGLTALVNETLGSALASRGGEIEMRLQPLREIYLHSNLNSELRDNGSMESVLLFSAIGLLSLLMAGFNFVSLKIARSTARSLEAAIRKTMGAGRLDLISQALCETFVVFAGAAFIAVVLLMLIVPKFGAWVGKDINSLDATFAVFTIAVSILFWLLLSVIPAVKVSSVSPARSVMARRIGGRMGIYVRRGLVFIQFVIGSTLLIGLLVINEQLDFIKSSDIGFDSKGVVLIDRLEELPSSTLMTLREEITRLPEIVSVSLSSGSPIVGPFPQTDYTAIVSSESKTELMVTIACDAEFISTLGLSVIRGRDFATKSIADSTDAVLVNETAVRMFGWDDPVGKTITTRQPHADSTRQVRKTIIGVVRDFNFSSLHQAIDPVVIVREPLIARHAYDQILAKAASGPDRKTIQAIETVWRKVVPAHTFRYRSYESLIDSAYEADENTFELIGMFGLLAVLVVILGSLGMTANTAEQRFKEIGIRKTFGASTSNIIGLLMKESMVLAVLGSIVASPLAYLLIQPWLDGFAYRVHVGLSIFLQAGIMSLMTAVAAAGYHSLKAGMSKPIYAIRHE